ncbi:DUF2147 domain-containing protein [Fulvivirga sediminis]|uniref:DUF2147 domain-containing protein n=1 Tax=Fulvivirga sediminis TaxID=2803949 RepID=A0A937K247_9BACT|nr:DUF2147 domain-containing protein [Fulvivirga sediminis]MBL3657402.1 DUF2147 domain-containing protein [Fulvivirga sediminis]
MRHIFIMILIFIMTNNSLGQNRANKITGTWYSNTKKGKVLIYKTGSQYYGKLIELEKFKDADGNELLDTNNPDETKRKRPLIGIVFLTDLKYDERKDRWKGRLYDYDGSSGNTYDSYITLKDDDILNIRGFWGLSWFGLNKGLKLTRIE